MIAENLARVRERIGRAACRSGRDPGDVTIVAVTKTFPREAVDKAHQAGLRTFGENRVQEIRAKFVDPLPRDAELHLIGPLQSNKVKQALVHVDVIETVDRRSLIEAIAKQSVRNGREVRTLIQVNVSGEPQKSGCRPDEVPALLDQLRAADIHCDGLMTIAPLTDDAGIIRATFRSLRERRDAERQRTGAPLDVLSMGMSNDFEIAIEEGATHVRIGRALFGER